MSSTHLNLQSLPDKVLKRAIILTMAMNAGHPDFLDTTEAGEIVWFDRDAKALFDVVFDEITRRATERGEACDIDGFEAMGEDPGMAGNASIDVQRIGRGTGHCPANGSKGAPPPPKQ